MNFAIIPSGKKPVAFGYKLAPILIILIGIAIILFARVKYGDQLGQLNAKPEKGVAVVLSVIKKPTLNRITYTVHDAEFAVDYTLKRDLLHGAVKALDKVKEGDKLPIRYSYTNTMQIEDANIVFAAIAEGYNTLLLVGIGVIVLGGIYIVPVAIAGRRFAMYGFKGKPKSK